MSITIKTNNVPRQLIYGYQLTDKEKLDFDYLEPEELETHEFFRYKGTIYDPSDFMAIDTRRECSPECFDHWHGYVSDSFFSGVLIKYEDDYDSVIVARYYS